MGKIFLHSYRQEKSKRGRLTWLLLALVLLCTSCLKDNDDDKVTYYGDTAISAFTLGTLNRTVHTMTASGADSTYQITIAGSAYKCYIDQQRHEIYNADSLPTGTDVAHVVCTIASKNSGIVMVKSLTSDDLTLYTGTDSIDFSEPRTLRVYSNDGSAQRDYTVKLNVHQEDGNTFRWTQVLSEEPTLASATRMRLAAVADRAVAFVYQGKKDVTLMVDLQKLATDGELSADEGLQFAGDVTDCIAAGNELLVMEGTKLHRLGFSENETWKEESLATVEGIAQLLGADGERVYARGSNGDLLMSADNGLTWSAELADNDASLLPTQDLSCMAIPSKTNPDVHRMLLIGNRDEASFPADTTPMVWGKSVEGDGVKTEWYYIDQQECTFPLPRLRSLAAICYDNLILAVGGSGFGGSKANAFTKIYASEDGGINWTENSQYELPKGFSSNDVFAMTVDAGNNIWMVCGESGQLWRGRLNRLGWK